MTQWACQAYIVDNEKKYTRYWGSFPEAGFLAKVKI
jgi:hypothetical protein